MKKIISLLMAAVLCLSVCTFSYASYEQTEAPLPYFEEMGLELVSNMNMMMEMPYTLKFTEDGESVEYNDLWFEDIVSLYKINDISFSASSEEGCVDVDLTYDIILHFKVCASSQSATWKEYYFNYQFSGFELADYNTGIVVPINKISEPGEKHSYSKEIEWNGETHELCYSDELKEPNYIWGKWTQANGRYEQTCDARTNVKMFITIPEDYDGAVVFLKEWTNEELIDESEYDYDTMSENDCYVLLDSDGEEYTAEQVYCFRLSDFRD